eukprot:m.80116 g.80116  ORF g.80116 m.80116 type:complete len:615 (+) comp8024_c0_seq1:3-1847(+)
MFRPAIVAVLAACAAAQLVRTSGGSIVFDIPGATMTLSPAASFPTPAGSSSAVAPTGATTQTELQNALIYTLSTTLDSSLAGSLDSVNSAVASSALAVNTLGVQTARVAADLSSLSSAVASNLAVLLTSMSTTNTTADSLSARAGQISSNLGTQISAASQIVQASLSAQINQIWTVCSTQIQSETTRALTGEGNINTAMSNALMQGLSSIQGTDASLAASLAAMTSSALAASLSFAQAGYTALQLETSAIRADTSTIRSQTGAESSRALAGELSLAASITAIGLQAATAQGAARALLYVNLTTSTSSESSRALIAEGSVLQAANSALLQQSSQAANALAQISANVSGLVTVQSQLNSNLTAAVNLTLVLRSVPSPFSVNLPAVASGTLWSWLDGSDPLGTGTPYSVQTNMGTWTDKGPNGINIDTRSGGSAGDIYFVPNVKNGRGAVFFTGNAYYYSSKQTTALPAGGLTWFLVYKTSPDTTQRSLATLLPVASPWYNWWNSAGGSTERWEAGASPVSDDMSGLTTNTWTVSVGRAGQTVSQYHTHMNTNTATGNPLLGGALNTIPATTRGVQLGYYVGSIHNNYIAESIIYSSYLSDADTNTIYTWLRRKWSI